MKIEEFEKSKKVLEKLEQIRNSVSYKTFIDSIIRADKIARNDLGTIMINVPVKLVYFKPKFQIKDGVIKKIVDSHLNRKDFHVEIENLTSIFILGFKNGEDELIENIGYYTTSKTGFMILPSNFDESVFRDDEEIEDLEFRLIVQKLQKTNADELSKLEDIASELMRYVASRV